MLYRVKHVTAEDNFQLVLTFTNNEVRLFDMTPYLNRGVFIALKDPAEFRKVHCALGTAVWPNELDISPDTLYLASSPVTNLR